MKTKIILSLLLGIDVLILLYQSTQLSISASEAKILYGNISFLQLATQFWLHIFENKDIGLRIFMIILHIIDALLLYKISKHYVKQERNRIWLIIVFLLLPGSLSSALIVSHASIIIFGLFLYIYLSFKTTTRNLYLLLLVYLVIEPGFSYLFLGLSIYNIFYKRKMATLYTLSLYFISIAMYGFVAHGAPSGHFLDTLGVYSAIYSPIVFVYLFYTLYRQFLIKKLDQIWFIATTAFIISIILSFRQRINLEYFAPYLMIVLPLAAQTFIRSYRVRLKVHRKRYKFLFITAFIFLFINALVVFFHKELYLILENPKKHFAYNVDIAAPLAMQLKQNNIDCITVANDKDMQLRLQFYNIEKCDKFILREIPITEEKDTNVTIRYKNKILYKADVTKLNNK